MSTTRVPHAGPGRPVATSHGEIEQAAFRLFASRGFDGTTLADIAAEVGIGRRTLFRYFESKNDIPWGQFAASLDSFREIFAAMPADLPLWRAIRRGILAFNDFDAAALPLHRQRMGLILTTPALQAHSVHQYAEWRRVIADFVAARRGEDDEALFPTLVGHLSLAVAVTAYETWLRQPDGDLQALLAEATDGLETLVGS